MTSMILALSLTLGVGAQTARFDTAKPIWPADREIEKNLFVGFRAVFEHPGDAPALLRVTGSTLYRAFVNGEFVAHGPARAGHGHYRIDEWDVTPLLRPGSNVVAIEVAGYNANSYYVLDQPSFLQAEVVADGKPLAATAGSGAPFDATILSERVQKTQRYSFQRPFMEVYRLGSDFARWREDPTAAFPAVACAQTAAKNLVPRRIPYPTFFMRPALRQIAEGRLETGLPVEKPHKDRALTGIGPELGGYPEDELDIIPSIELQGVRSIDAVATDTPLRFDTPLALPEKTFRTLDLGTNLSGFLGATVTCARPTRLHFTFDEILVGDDVNWARLSCVNVITWELPAGTFYLESFEPYTMRYVKILNVEGDCEIREVFLREYTYPDVWENHFMASDPRLNRLFAAGRETFAQNSTDVFMDCPSRERAGWLCDSFFTARTAQLLAGDTLLEKNFIENFLLPERFEHLPEGMLPMCYPADHYNGNFIPNWALWFVVQLEEYLARSDDRALVQALRPRVMALFDYFKPFLNEDGLLEKLEKWVFVEWSAANRFVQDVNYPSNMLYAGALASAGRMYNDPALLAQAEAVRETVRRQSFDGSFFVDNAVRTDGKLQVTDNRTEVCQYFAFYFDVATPATHPELWSALSEQFGPDRKETKAFPEIHEANSFIGNMLRFELLSRYGRGGQILDESLGYLLYMAERTGTLWENVHDHASCNHGFASHICYTLHRDILGVYRLDPIDKTVELRFNDLSLDWCEGRIPLPDGALQLFWFKEGDTFFYRLDLPAGYDVSVENRTGRALVHRF